MDERETLLMEVAETARTGMDAVRYLLDKTTDTELRGELAAQEDQYHVIMREAERLLIETGVAPKPKPMAKMGMHMGIEKETLTDKSSAHLADIVIQGTTMGIVELTRAKQQNAQAAPDAIKLADTLIGQSQEAIDRAKAFLK